MIEHLSYSSISLYQTCGKAWQYRYIDKVNTATSPALVFGSAWHATVEAMIIDRPQLTGANPIERWRTAWNAQLEKNQNIDWGDATAESHFNEGVRMITDLGIQMTIENIRVGGADSIERKIELNVPGVSVPVIGFIDVITEDGIPGDIKTSAKSWSDDKATSELQPLFYLAALSQAGYPVDGGRFKHYVFVKTKTPKVQVIEHAHNMKEMFFLFGMIQNVWKGIGAGVFVENPNCWMCNAQYCNYWQLCRGRWQ
jgi:hypothetical protein